MTFHISTFASDDEGSYKNNLHWSWEPLWAQSVYTYIVTFEASYPLIIGERWLRANSWPAAGLAPSSLLLSPMLRMCVCFSAAASSCCSLFPVWPAGGAEQASGRDDGGVLHWRTDGPSHCIHVSLCDQWTNQLSAGSALSGDLLFVFILKIRTFRCTAEKKKNETQHNTARNMVEGKQLRAAAEPRGEEAEAESVPAVCWYLSPYHKCTSM